MDIFTAHSTIVMTLNGISEFKIFFSLMFLFNLLISLQCHHKEYIEKKKHLSSPWLITQERRDKNYMASDFRPRAKFENESGTNLLIKS